VEEVFAIRVKTAEAAQELKVAFEAAQAEMQKLMDGGDGPDKDSAADEAAKALEGLGKE